MKNNILNKSIENIINTYEHSTVDEYVNKVFKEIKDNSKKYENQFITLSPEIAKNQILNLKNKKTQLLYGVPFSAKDNICSYNHLTTGGCKILDNFIPSYNAHILDKLEEAGAILIGKNNLDELGMGGTGLSSKYGNLSNPWDEKRICGGSSSGSAISVSLGLVPFSIGTDTGDSVRQPANYCGIIGFKPSWNRISKYGIIPYTPSLDTIGIFSRSVKDSAMVYEIISGYDKKDAMSWNEAPDKVFSENRYELNASKFKKCCVISEIYEELKKYPKYLELFNKELEFLKSIGVVIVFESFDLKLLKALSSTYNILSYAEATSCQAYLQGIAFGERKNKETWQNSIIETRKLFTKTTKFRQIMGSFFLLEENRNEYFERAKKVRRIIHEKMKQIFSNYDALVLPCSGIAPTIEEIMQCRSTFLPFNLLADHLLLANFYGSPSISVPIGLVDKMPYGISITTNQFCEDTCLSIASAIESHTNWKNIIAGDYAK